MNNSTASNGVGTCTTVDRACVTPNRSFGQGREQRLTSSDCIPARSVQPSAAHETENL